MGRIDGQAKLSEVRWLNSKIEVGKQKETKPTKQEGVGTFGLEIILTVSFRSESLFPSRSLLPSVNSVSEFGMKYEPHRRACRSCAIVWSLGLAGHTFTAWASGP